MAKKVVSIAENNRVRESISVKKK